MLAVQKGNQVPATGHVDTTTAAVLLPGVAVSPAAIGVTSMGASATFGAAGALGGVGGLSLGGSTGDSVQTLWLSPANFVTGDPTLRISYPYVAHPSTEVSCTAPGDFKWVSLGLQLPPDVYIDEIIVYHEVSNERSFIAQVRLAEMTSPQSATVIYDDPSHLTSTTPASHSSPVGGYVPTGAMTLELRLNFQDTNDKVFLGAVAVKIRPVSANASVGQLLTASGNIGQGSVVRTANDGKALLATTLLRDAPFSAVSLQPLADGMTGAFQPGGKPGPDRFEPRAGCPMRCRS